MRNKNIILSIVVIIVGLTIAGGTYAYLSVTANVTNAVYNASSRCFIIDYSVNDVDGTQEITGTMFPSSDPSKGLSGRVGLVRNSTCNMNGTGTLYLHVDNSISSKFGDATADHCENLATLETLKEYKTEEACTNAGGTWRNLWPALKYAVYSSDSATGTPLKVGYIGHPIGFGNANNDVRGLKDASDALCVQQFVAGKQHCVASAFNADVNLNLMIDEDDSSTILKYAAGKIITFKAIEDATGLNIPIYEDFTINETQQYFYVYIWLDGYVTDNTYTDLSFSGYIWASATQNE